MPRGKGSFRLNLRELAAVIGCGDRVIVRVVRSLGIAPVRVEKRRALYSLNEAQIKRVIIAYHCLANDQPYMQKARTRPPSAAARLKAYWSGEAALAARRRAETAKAARPQTRGAGRPERTD